MHDGTAIRLEQQLLGAAVALVLLDGMLGALTREIVLELHRHHGDTVHKEHHVYRVVLVVGHGAVAQLPHHLEAVGAVALPGVGVLVGGGAEEAQAKLRPRRHADAVAQHVEHAAPVVVRLQLVAEPFEEPLARVRAVQPLDLAPLIGLGLPHEAHERVHLEGELAVVIGLRFGEAAEGAPPGSSEHGLHVVLEVALGRLRHRGGEVLHGHLGAAECVCHEVSPGRSCRLCLKPASGELVEVRCPERERE